MSVLETADAIEDPAWKMPDAAPTMAEMPSTLRLKESLIEAAVAKWVKIEN